MKESLVEVALIESETSIPCYPLYLEGVHVCIRKKKRRGKKKNVFVR